MPDFAIACGHQLTAQAGADVLHAGGNAVDAAVAAALMATVVEPVLAGLFGGGFLLVRDISGRSDLLDFFVSTPLAAVPQADLDFRAIGADFGKATQEFHIGAGAIATPGMAPGLAAAHARFGRMPIRELAAPAATAARTGFPINDYQAQLAQIVVAILSATESARALFGAGDDLQPAGSVWRNPDLADVLDTFAAEGPRLLTEGEVAQALLGVTEDGGHLRAADLKDYAPEWRNPLIIRRGQARIALNPPPALGGALIAFALELATADPGPVDLLAALQATSAARLESSLDRDAISGVATLLNPALIARYREQVAGRPKAVRGTTHISVIDRDGMGAAMTMSNGAGSGLVVPGTGIAPNNMLGEADLSPGGFHDWPTGQRMGSMMCPIAVDWPDGQFAMLGSGGSNRIRTALAQVLINVIDRGQALEDAITAPRLHLEPGDPLAVDFEDLGGEAYRDAILSAYPNAQPWPDCSMFFGGVHAVRGGPRGASDAAGDPRRSGVAVRS